MAFQHGPSRNPTGDYYAQIEDSRVPNETSRKSGSRFADTPNMNSTDKQSSDFSSWASSVSMLKSSRLVWEFFQQMILYGLWFIGKVT
jgi:hypothetical protein